MSTGFKVIAFFRRLHGDEKGKLPFHSVLISKGPISNDLNKIFAIRTEKVLVDTACIRL